ncbi:hypothetical protein Glove_26g193 [Diversispora epigaea]|uniref:Uncharacterized protein n=1 Tax=Diversispora epigaea TaxID=1348612 RepID=A0A397JUQ8_9GLOM|nr:hypothetical protein Glove_26g193 [Diversispora epigaea]
MTNDEKEYIHSLKNFSKNSHTEEFLKNESIKVIEEKLLGERKKSVNELIAQISNYFLKSKPYDFEFVTGIHTELSDEGFEDVVTKTTFSFDDKIFEDENKDELENNQFENDDELENNQFENNEGENQISNFQNFDSFFNVTDIELQ